jgi:hypothetical protein
MPELLKTDLSSSECSFERDPRRVQEKRCRPYADIIYHSVFGDDIKIVRDANIILDKEFAIDVQIRLDSGLVLLGQEKFLSENYAKYATVTVEYYQNQFTKERGDWFKIGVQFYFTGYETKNGFNPYILLNWPQTVLATDVGLIKWLYNTNKDGHAKASFMYYSMSKFPSSCIIAGMF